MPQASSGQLLAPRWDDQVTAISRSSLCEAEAPDNSKGFQMFRQQMQLQTICNWLY
jgi:hypothetical protein